MLPDSEMEFHRSSAVSSFGRIDAGCQMGGNNDRLFVTRGYEYGWHSTAPSTSTSKGQITEREIAYAHTTYSSLASFCCAVVRET